MPVLSLTDLIAQIPDGAKIAVPNSNSGVAMAATRALIAAGVSELHLVAYPTSGIQADMLIGAGCVRTVESAGISLDEQGQAGRFVAAVKQASLTLKDSTCPAIVSGIQAAEKGVPFLPMRGLLGSDLLKYRDDYVVIDNPMADDADPIVLIPAIKPDIALFHAPMADRFGNIWIGKMRELMTLAHAATRTLVTVEKIVDENLMRDPLRAGATIPEMYITSVAEVENGAWPLALEGCYEADNDALRIYARAAKTSAGFAEYLGETVAQAAQ